ncbi:MAG: 2-phospho-L-lactate guanylyltransferase [Nocardioidaceae bacterium]
MTRDHMGPPAVWNLIIPVKGTGLAKSRLTPFSQPHRAALALAFALDAASAGLASPRVRRVVAVTNDRAAVGALSAIGVEVAPDEPAAGLNAAVARGAALIRQEDPLAAVAAMCGDLPAVRAVDLTALLTAVGSVPRWFVADAAGVGTTMLAAWEGELEPAFGPGSRARHQQLGAADIVEVVGDVPAATMARLRRDVDTLDDLTEARKLGVGPRTNAALIDIEAA